MQKVTVTLTDKEYQALEEMAHCGCRTVDQQLRHLLRERAAADTSHLYNDPELDTALLASIKPSGQPSLCAGPATLREPKRGNPLRVQRGPEAPDWTEAEMEAMAKGHVQG